MTFASQFRRGEGDERQIRSANGRLTVGVLTAAQALSMTGVSIVTLTTGLAGTYLAASPTLATAPLAAQFVATMCATFPAAMFMRKYGRRAGFTMGQIIGLLGALFSVYALMEQSFLLFLAAGAVLGVHNAFWGYYRFAAAEAADPAFKTRAISMCSSPWCLPVAMPPSRSCVPSMFWFCSSRACPVLRSLRRSAQVGRGSNCSKTPSSLLPLQPE